MVARGFRLTVMAVVCVIAGGLLFASGSAFAAVTYPFDGQFGVGVVNSSGFGVVVNAVNDFNQDVYVVDERIDVVNVLGANGAPVQASIDGTPAESFGAGLKVAANNGTGNVYVLDGAHNVIDEFDSSGNYLCQITSGPTPSSSECNGPAGSEVPAPGFEGLRNIAVNQVNGDVYVSDTEHGVIDVFSATGKYQRQIALSVVPESFPEGFIYTTGLVVDGNSGQVYVIDSARSSVYEFNASGEYASTLAGLNTPASSFGDGEMHIAVNDSTGNLYVTTSAQRVTDVFDSSGGYVTQFSHSYRVPLGTAVDQATGEVYVSDLASAPAPSFVDIFGPGLTVPDVHTAPATEVAPTSATLNGTVDPDGIQVSDCHFDYGTDTSYGQTTPCAPSADSISVDSSEHSVSAHLTGLQPGITYHFRLDASNANSTEGPNVGADETLSTPPRPSIENALATNVTRSSADLTATIDPKKFATKYNFEWGETASYGNRVPLLPGEDKEIEAGSSAKTVSTHITVPEENRTYHWRVLATNANGTTVGADHTFVYDTSGGGLPDNRAYEMVTPPQKDAAAIGVVIFGVPPTISEDGSRMTGTSIQCFAGAQSCTASRENEGEPYLFTRTSRGWVTTPFAPAASMGENSAWLDNASAGTALLSIATPPANEDDWFTAGTDGKLIDAGPTSPPSDGAYGVEFGSGPYTATPDLSHIVWQSAPIWPFGETGKPSIYEYVGHGNTTPILVGVSGGPGSVTPVSMCGAGLDGDISLDGSVIYFTAIGHDSGEGECPKNLTAPSTSQLYARVDQSETVDVSQRSTSNCDSGSGCASSPPGDAKFEAASVDGSRVFFTDTQQLTNDAGEDGVENDSSTAGKGCEGTTGANGCNLYEYDLSRPTGEGLLAVSAGDTSGGGPRVQRVVGVSADGTHVYFVAKGILSRVANDRGQTAQNGGENMYVFERDASYPHGHVTFITTLPKSDVIDVVAHESEFHQTSVTPDGRFIVFTSRGDLTQDDTGEGQIQVFRYDSQTGNLLRISIGNDGFNDDGNRPVAEVCDSNGCPTDASIASSTSTERRDQTMSHDGAYVFFQSSVGLTPQALNDVQVAIDSEGHPLYAQNVYEWHGGHVYLISDGRDTTTTGSEGLSTVKLLGADATGANVFFSTGDSMVPEDTDTQLDYYDARICIASDPCIAPAPSPLPPCLGEACHGTPAGTPPSPNVPTSTFSGQGNLIAPAVKSGKAVRRAVKCVKGKRLVRGRCAKAKAKRRKGRAKKAAQSKRSGRGRGSESHKGEK